jgi:hypothetical protein
LALAVWQNGIAHILKHGIDSRELAVRFGFGILKLVEQLSIRLSKVMDGSMCRQLYGIKELRTLQGMSTERQYANTMLFRKYAHYTSVPSNFTQLTGHWMSKNGCVTNGGGQNFH